MTTSFLHLVAVKNAEFMADTAPATTDANALEGITDHLEWIAINLDEGDPDIVKLENLACAVAAAGRFADLLLARISKPEVDDLIEASRPVESEEAQ